jgi:serine/threonine protein kinase
LAANDEIINETSGRVYQAKEVLGKGTFGQVVHVVEKSSGKEFAAKIIKSKKNYTQFVLNYEVKILSVLNKYEKKAKDSKVKGEGSDVKKKSRIICLYEKFVFKDHIVLIMEKLDMSVFDLLKIANFQGFTLNVIRKFGRHILEGLSVLKKNKIVHCDLKPENILLIK